MGKCGSLLWCCSSSKTYQPLSMEMSRGSSFRADRQQMRKPSVRYDVVRPAARRNSDHPAPHCHLPGTLRTPVSHCNNNYPLNQGHSHDRAPPSRCTAPRTNYPAPPHGCALHPRLDQPVTSSTHAMDDKKVVQSAPSATAGQQVRVKSALDGTGVVASISGARRRSGPQGLRSPAAKRPLSAPVALQGWLHKQGSEGLMLWKKRWFVLSEYCLFYYKGPEEEKLLGSILLPSYRVTLCKPEDKVNKKFAFKAEHANMRTYHFAADTRESMNQWVNALTLATLLQDPNPMRDEAPAQEIAGPAEGEHSARPSVSSISSILNQSADDSDSGFHGFQSRDDPSQSNNNSSPNSVNTASFPNLSASNSNHGIASSPDRGQDGAAPLMNGWMQPPAQFGQPSTSQQFVQNAQPMGLMQQHLRQHHVAQMASNVHAVQPMLRNFGQPVYANAPPKPRRLTDGTEYSTPSPDPEFRKSPVQPGARMTAKSPISDYDRGNVIYASRLAHQSTPPLRTDKSGLNYGYSQAQPAERRTPDTYGRSAKPRVSRGNADYEDVYGAPQLYQRPPGPVGYSKGPAPVPIPIPVYAQHQQQVCPVMPANAAAVMRPARTLPPPRPHSADFLEYEASRDPCTQGQSQAGVQGQPRRPQRPKSSMDVVGSSDLAPPGGDGYFYSEERYAAQMRQSSVYLHQTPQHHQQQRNQSLSRATTPSKSVARGEDASNSMALNEISCPNSARKSPREQSLYRQHPMATQSLQRYTEASTNEAMVRRSLRERSYDPSFHDPLSHSESGTVPRRAPRDHESNPATSSSRLTGTLGPQITQSYHGNHSSARRWTDQQFARSASARLPRTRHPSALDQPDDSEYESRTTGQSPRDGERRIQQREESMKRLLEWKQRMLQSPLTRKPSATANPSATAQSELSSYYRRQALLDLAAHEASITEARHSRRRDDSHRAHVRSKSSDGRRSVVANVSRYNSYSSDDEEPGDVRRKRARRPSHAGRSPRQIGDDNPATSLGHDYDCKGRNTILQTPPSVSFTPLSPGGIPPDAGYEEVSFPSDQDSASVSSNLTNQTLTVKTPKKPGILKTPSSYSRSNGNTESAGRLNTLAGYIPESWQAPKNVQWNSSDDKENWDAKIDESRVIKEFSYQYIKPEEIDNDAKPETESTNSVQSRIRSFESSLDEDSPVQELLSMQEPLKVAPSPAIEAHVSRVDSSRKSTSNIREFALGDIDHDNHIESNETRLSDGTKSVKDLLADFERKSQQVRRQENNRREEIAHRGVFSDTETLLYDTGSDLDQPDRSEEINVRRNKEKKRQMHDSAIERRNAMSPEVQPSLSQVDGLTDSQETIAATPEAFARLSVTESMVTHDNSGDELPKHEDPSPEEHYLPMSPRKAILDPNNDDLPDSMMQSLFDNLRHEESSYVEMSQNHTGHSLLAPDGKLDSGDYSVLEASHYEFVCVADNKVEPVYMEVSQLAGKEGKDTSKCLRRKDSSGNTQCMRLDLPDILTALKSDSSDADDESSKDLESIDAPRHPRFSLSDTFRPASYYLGASRTLIELHDSSDSELVSPPPIPTSPPPMEELDSDMQEGLEVKKCLPQVPVSRDAAELSPKSWRKPTGQVETPRSPSRFSDATISSTFRDSRASLESASGSDSLELRNPDEEARHRRLKRRPVSDEVCEVLDSLDELESLGSRFDGASIDLDQYLEELQARDAFNVDLYTKDLSYNSIYGFNENMLVADKLQKTTSQEIAKINLNASSLDQPFHYNSRTKTSSASSLPSMRVSDAPPSHQHSQSFTGDAHYENVVTFTPRCEEKPRDELQQKNRAQPSHSRDSSYSTASGGCTANSSNNCHQPSSAFSASMTSLMGCVVSGNHGNSRPSNQSPYNEQSRNHSRSASQDSTRYSLSPHHRSSSSQDSTQLARNSPAIGHGHASNVPEQEPDQTGAPYYYSDLQTGVSGFDAQVSRPTQTLIAHTSRLPQLNNQRGDSALNKRNDISRLVNPITRQMPRRIEVEDIDEARRIAAELRKNSRQFLMADNKSDLLDKRNIYESDTLRRVKCTEAHADLSLPDVSSVNIYPHGLRDKSGSQTHLDVPEQSVQPSHRRSRSLEGLLDDIGLQNLVEQRNRANRVPAPVGNDESGPSVTEGVVTEEPFEGEDPWEQDSLWRESLRRVSIRHARSLDNLDTPRGSEDSRTRPKITRGATYVNDSVARLASPDPTERPRVKRRVAEEDDDGTYEALTMDRAEGGFAWNTETQKHFLDEGNLPPARQAQRRSFELDREKLRQWDLLSSACLLQEQQRNSMAESLGRGLPTRVNHEDEGKSTTTEARGMTIIRENGRASGSGSIIGRDPLPPRAVSTSQLAAQNPLTQPPMVVTTLPHARANGRQQSDSPVVHHATTPQARNLANDSSESGRMASDVAPPSIMVNNESLSEGNQCLMVSPRNLRVVSPIDHRVSSPSDSERHIRSSSERNLASPISMREMNGDTGSLRQMQRVVQGRESTSDLLHKRTSTIPKQKSVTSEAGSRPGSTTGSSSRLVQVSAGELLGRTHEELVLLLIQLRRQSAAIYKAMETCHMEIEAQARLAELDAPRRLENLQKLEELKKHLMNLEKQYEKGKPLVNLVDNMVKLGSLYNRSGVNGSVSGSRHDLLQAQESARERLEFNQRVQEQRLLAEERRDWDRLSPDHGQLQAKVQQLYKLDRLLQEESGTLHSLQQDKEILEKALGGLKYKLQGSRSNPIETERYRKQQILLERELSRVRMLLAHNSKKLEETVAENARLEQDLVVLRQKLQASRRFGGNMARDPSGTTATLEAELRRVQQLVGDLQRQRQDLSIQVRQLTEKSHSLVQQIKPNDLCNVGQQLHHPKKRLPSSWLETDLDSGMTFDHGMASPSSSSSSMSPRNRQNGSPHQHIPSPQYKEPPAPPPSHGYSPTQIARQPQSNHQAIYIQAYSRPSDAAPHNHISTLSPQLREQIQQHQLKQQLLKDQMQGKASPVQGAIAPLYINTTDNRRINCNDPMKRIDSTNVINSPPEYIPPPPPPPADDVLMMNGGYGHHEDNKFPGLMHGREKPEIKTVRIVKRESERRQRDRGDRNGNIGIPLTNGLQAPGGAKRLTDEDFTSQQFEKTQLGRVVEETAIIHAQSTMQLSELDDVQFQRSMSLPRGFGGQRPQTGTTCGPVPPPPRSDSMNALRNMMARRHRVRFENQEASSDSTLSLYTDSPTSNSQLPLSSPNYSTSPSYSPSNQNYVSPYTRPSSNISPGIHAETVGSTSSARSASLSSLMSPCLMPSPVPVVLSAQERLGSLASINSLGESPQLSPVFKSEAAKQIIKEMTEKKTDGRRRPVPKEKRRHYTVSSSKPMLDLEDTFSKMGMGRARDDLDMERALRPRINAPDVVRSTLSHKELKYNESTIDQLLGTPNKIVIPERYIPEHTPELSAEEKKQRLKKADAIRKMLSETTVTTGEGDDDEVDQKKSNSLKKKVAEEKRQRDHILQLNQILAKQVMEKSKMVAARALATLPLNTQTSFEDDDLSPVTPLPLYQQRENFYS